MAVYWKYIPAMGYRALDSSSKCLQAAVSEAVQQPIQNDSQLKLKTQNQAEFPALLQTSQDGLY